MKLVILKKEGMELEQVTILVQAIAWEMALTKALVIVMELAPLLDLQ